MGLRKATIYNLLFICHIQFCPSHCSSASTESREPSTWPLQERTQSPIHPTRNHGGPFRSLKTSGILTLTAREILESVRSKLPPFPAAHGHNRPTHFVIAPQQTLQTLRLVCASSTRVACNSLQANNTQAQAINRIRQVVVQPRDLLGYQSSDLSTVRPQVCQALSCHLTDLTCRTG